MQIRKNLKRNLNFFAVVVLLAWSCSSVTAQVPSTDPNLGNNIEVSSVEWVALNEETSASALDANPNTGGGLRIYPDDQVPREIIKRNEVLVKAHLSEARAGVKVYFKSFDVDDPSTNYTEDTEANSVDPDDTADMARGGDNRGTPKEGAFSGGVNVVVTDAAGMASIRFSVTMQPGDNFRVAASTSPEVLSSLTNDSVPPVGSSTSDQRPLPTSVRLTELLTVWRRLHLELDSMSAPTGNEDKVVSEITAITAHLDTTYSCTLSTNLQTDPQVITRNTAVSPIVNDNSKNLDTDGNGRFENGSVAIGTTQVVTSNLLGNGDTFIKTKPGQKFQIPFTLSMTGKTDVTGAVVGLRTSGVHSVFTVDTELVEGSFDPRMNTLVTPPTEVIAELSICGHKFNVLSNTVHDITVTVGNAKLACVLSDDDVTAFTVGESVQSILPHTVNVGDDVRKIFAQAYILPLADGGGSSSYNNTTVAFRRNTQDVEGVRYLSNVNDCGPYRSSKFWAENIVSVFQGRPFGARADRDPDGEGMHGAYASLGGPMIVFCRQDLYETTYYPGEQNTIAHELGHSMGIQDRYNEDKYNLGTGKNGLMGGGREFDYFIGRDLDWLRRGVNSPGSNREILGR